MKILAFFSVFMLAASTVYGAEGQGVLGPWKTVEEKSTVQIYRCEDRLCGKIVDLREPNYTKSEEGPVGSPKVDRHNPDEALRSAPILGLRIMEGFVPTGDNEWGKGTIYDPESGKTYRCKMKMENPDRLEVRGYIGISLLGRTTVWTR